MNLARDFERMLYECPVIKVSEFEPIGADEFTFMTLMAGQNREKVLIFPYLRRVGENFFADIYVWDIMFLGEYRRFVICKDCYMSEDDEDTFIAIMSSNRSVHERLFNIFLDGVKKEFPQVPLNDNCNDKNIFLNMYFSLHRCGVKEILYKAKLDIIAAHLDEIDDYNMIGSSPENIFDMPIGMLRALNNPSGYKVLIKPEHRLFSKEIYKEFHNLFNKKQVKYFQWFYLKYVLETDLEFDKKKFELFAKVKRMNMFESYMLYWEKREMVLDYYAHLPEYPSVFEFYNHESVCDTVLYYIENEEEIDRRIRRKLEEFADRYYGENNRYKVIIPSSVKELLKEATDQHNCLYNYVDKVASSSALIVCIREKNNIDKALVTVEINVVTRQVVQAYGAFNRELTDDEADFLNKYMAVKNLEYDGFEDDYWDFLDEDDDFDEMEDW